MVTKNFQMPVIARNPPRRDPKQSIRFGELKVPSLSRDWIAILPAGGTLRASRDDNQVILSDKVH